MGNILETVGAPETRPRIGDMLPGDVGYAVEWAIEDGDIREDYTIGEKGGTLSVRVECVGLHEYKIMYEKPEYMPIAVTILPPRMRLVRWAKDLLGMA